MYALSHISLLFVLSFPDVYLFFPSTLLFLRFLQMEDEELRRKIEEFSSKQLEASQTLISILEGELDEDPGLIKVQM